MISIVDTRGPAFHTGQIRDVGALASKLRGKTERISAFLFNQLDETTRRKTVQGSVDLEQALVSELNKIVESKSIYEPDRFQQFQLRPETKKLVASHDKLSAHSLKTLNRLLLEDSLGEYFYSHVPKTDGKISMLHISDLHLRSDMDLDRRSRQYVLSHFEDRLAKECRRETEGKYVDLILFTGDLVEYGNIKDRDHEACLITGKELLERIADQYCTIGRRGLVIIPGNHDYRWIGMAPVAAAQERFVQTLKDYLGHKLFRFEFMDLVVACFDSNKGDKLDWARGEIEIGDLNALNQRLQSLAKELDRAGDSIQRATKVALVHHHPFPVPAADRVKPHGYENIAGKPLVGGAEYMLMRNAGVFVNKLLQHDFRLVLHGHLHEKGYWRVVSHDENDSEKWLEVLAGASLVKGKFLSFNLAVLESNGFLRITNCGWNDEGNPSKNTLLPSVPYEIVRLVPPKDTAKVQAASGLLSVFWRVFLDKGDLALIEIVKGCHAISKPVDKLPVVTTSSGLASTEFKAKEIGQGNQTVGFETQIDPSKPHALGCLITFQPELQQNSNCDFAYKVFLKGCMFRSRDDQIGVGDSRDVGWDSVTRKIVRPTEKMIMKLRFVADQTVEKSWIPERINFEVKDENGRPCPLERDCGHIVFEHISPRTAKDCWLENPGYDVILTVHKPRLNYNYILKWELQDRVSIPMDVQRWQDCLLSLDTDSALETKAKEYLGECLQALTVLNPKFKDGETDVAAFLFAYDRGKHELVSRVSVRGQKATPLLQNIRYGHDVVGTAFRRRELQQFPVSKESFEFLRRLRDSGLQYILACPINLPDQSWPVGVVAFASVKDTSRLHEFCSDKTLKDQLSKKYSELFAQSFLG